MKRRLPWKTCEAERDRQQISRSSARRDKPAHAVAHLFVRHAGAARVSRGLVLELRGRRGFGRGGACDGGRGGATARTAGVARLRMIHCRHTDRRSVI